jgi:hypothetical protein
MQLLRNGNQVNHKRERPGADMLYLYEKICSLVLRTMTVWHFTKMLGEHRSMLSCLLSIIEMTENQHDVNKNKHCHLARFRS